MSGKKLSKNIVIYGLSNGLKSLVPFIMLPLLTGYISASEYGTLSIIETTLLFLTPFIILNFDGFLSVEYFKSNKEELSQYISNGVFLTLLAFLFTFILFFIVQTPLSAVLSISTSILLVLPILVLLKYIPTMVLVLFQAQQKSISYLLFSLLQTIVDYGLSSLFIIIFLKGYVGRLIGIYGAFFLFTILGVLVLYRMQYLDFSWSKEKIKQILNFGLPLIPHAIGGTVIALSDRYFISYFVNNEELGFYTASYQISAVMLLVSRSVNQAWSPMLFELIKTRKVKQINRFIWMLLIGFSTFGVLTYLSADILFDLLVDPSFYAAKIYFPILLLGFVLQSFYFVFSGFIFYTKRTRILASISFTAALINLILNYILIHKMGVIGVAYATVITWSIFLASTFLIYQFRIKKTLYND